MTTLAVQSRAATPTHRATGASLSVSSVATVRAARSTSRPAASFAPGYCVGIDPDEGADGGYQGLQMAAAVAAISREWEIEIVKRPELRKFVVLPKRWIVELTFAWLSRCRRLAKDFENLTCNALAFLRLASIRLRKLCIPR